MAAEIELVVLVDPRNETTIAWDARGSRAFARDEVFAHDALPGFAFALEPLFAKIR
jgi:hypothetical protein